MCRPLGVHTTFTSRNTLRKSLTKVKGRPGMLDVKGVVYSIRLVRVGVGGQLLLLPMNLLKCTTAATWDRQNSAHCIKHAADMQSVCTMPATARLC